jgi:CRP-like cAMP-binding protein
VAHEQRVRGRKRVPSRLGRRRICLVGRAHKAFRRFDLHDGDFLQHAGNLIDAVIFPNSGLVALTVPTRNGAGAGAMIIGREGFVGGFGAIASNISNCDAEVFVAGHASRISAFAFRYALEQSTSLLRSVARFNAALMAQAQQTALCNAIHPVEARICRWLLDFHDRSEGEFPLTQAGVARLLGVQRTTINLATGRLERAGALRCRRGHMQVVRRDELERQSCECYAYLKEYAARLRGAPEDGAEHAASTIGGRSTGHRGAPPAVS